MATKIMQKPYHIAGYDSKGEELYRLTAMPPTLPGVNEDNKKPKNKEGEWIRTFTVTDSGNSSYSIGDKITMNHPRGEYPYLNIEDNITLKVELIEGVKAEKKVSKKKSSKKLMVDIKPDVNPASDIQTPSPKEEEIEVLQLKREELQEKV